MIGSAKGTTPITFPNNFNELFIKVDAVEKHDVFYSFLLPRIALSTEAKILLIYILQIMMVIATLKLV